MARYKGKFAKKRKQGQKLLLPALAVILFVGLITAGMAYYLQETGGKTASYQMASVSCEIHEEFNGQTKTYIKVQNTSNVPVYIRVRLVSYWQTPSGKIAGRSSPTLTFTLGDKWEPKGENTWIYSKPVDPGKMTGDLLGTGLTLTKDDEGYIPVVKVLAEAIQEDAAQTAWNWNPAK